MNLNKEKKYFILIISFGFAIRLIYIFNHPEFLEDSYTWSIISQETWSNHGIYSDPFGGHDRIWPPLWGMIGAFVTNVVPIKYDLDALRIFNATISLLTLSIIWSLTRKGFQNQFMIPRLFFALAYCCHPFLIVHGTQGTNLPLGVLLIACMLWTFQRFDDNKGIFLAGIFIGLACLSRYEYWILVPIMIPLLQLIMKVNLKKIIIFSIPAFLLPSCWVIRRINAEGQKSFIEHYISGEAGKSSNLLGNAFSNGLHSISFPFYLTVFLSFALFLAIIIYIFEYKKSSKGNIVFLGIVINIIIYFELAILAFTGISPAWRRYHILYFPLILPLLASFEVIKSLKKTMNITIKKLNKIISIKIHVPIQYAHLKKVTVIIISIIIVILGFYGTLEYDDNFGDLDYDLEAGEILKHRWDDKGGRILCDLPAVVISSSIPIKYFDRTSDLSWNQTDWLKTFKERDINFLIYTDRDYAFISYVGQDKILNNSPKEITYIEIWNSSDYERVGIVIYEVLINGFN